jgi:hypothetical protein
MKNRPDSPHKASPVLSSRAARLVCLVALVASSLWVSPVLGGPVAAGARAAQAPPVLATRSDANGTVLEIQAPDYELVENSADGSACQMLRAAGLGLTDEVGWPMIPVRGAMLGLPPGAVPEIRVLEADFDTVALPADLCPVPAPVVREDPGPAGNGPGEAHVEMVYAKDGGAYATNAFYPANLAVSTGEARLRDQRVVQLSARPFQYNPVTRELRVYHTLRVEVAFAYPQGRQDSGASGEIGGPFETTLKHALLNYDAARQWREKPAVPSLPLLAPELRCRAAVAGKAGGAQPAPASADGASGVRAHLQGGSQPGWTLPADLCRPGGSRDAGGRAEPADLPVV